jgi:hypothetical protein
MLLLQSLSFRWIAADANPEITSLQRLKKPRLVLLSDIARTRVAKSKVPSLHRLARFLAHLRQLLILGLNLLSLTNPIARSRRFPDLYAIEAGRRLPVR